MTVGRDEYDSSVGGFPEEVVLGEVSRAADVAAQEFALTLNLAERALLQIGGDPYELPFASRAALDAEERRWGAKRVEQIRAALGQDTNDFARWEDLT